MLDNAVYGWDPFGYRFTNLLLNAAAGVLVFVVVWEWLGSFAAALIAGLLFAVHPAHSEAAGWISSRCDLMYTLFFLGAYIVFSRRDRSGHVRTAALTLTPALYLAALLSKEAAMLFIPLALIDDWARKRRWRMRRLAGDYLPLLAATAIYLVARTIVVGSLLGRSTSAAVVFDRVTDAPADLLFYLHMVVWPSAQVPYTSKLHIAPEHVALYFAGILAACYLLYRLGGASRKHFLLLMWVLLPLLAVCDILPFITAWLAARFTYLPTAGIAAIYGGALAWLLSRARGKTGKAGAILLVLLLLGTWTHSTMRMTSYWRSNTDLFGALRKQAASSAARTATPLPPQAPRRRPGDR